MAYIAGLVRALREGDDAAKTAAAYALGHFAWPSWENGANKAAIAEAGGIAPLVELVRDGSADVKRWAAAALRTLACRYAANQVLIAEAGAIAPLVELLRNRRGPRAHAAFALGNLARNNDANTVAIAATIGLEALVQLARRGSVTVENGWVRVVSNPGLPAKRKAALVVAALLRACVPDSVPRDIKAVIGSYL